VSPLGRERVDDRANKITLRLVLLDCDLVSASELSSDAGERKHRASPFKRLAVVFRKHSRKAAGQAAAFSTGWDWGFQFQGSRASRSTFL
jgi:hypothetical protein